MPRFNWLCNWTHGLWYWRIILQFTAFPFSLTIALWVFTWVTRSFMLALSHQEVEIMIYLDDWLIQYWIAYNARPKGILLSSPVITGDSCLTLPSPILPLPSQLCGQGWNGTPGQLQLIFQRTINAEFYPRCTVP